LPAGPTPEAADRVGVDPRWETFSKKKHAFEQVRQPAGELDTSRRGRPRRPDVGGDLCRDRLIDQRGPARTGGERLSSRNAKQHAGRLVSDVSAQAGPRRPNEAPRPRHRLAAVAEVHGAGDLPGRGVCRCNPRPVWPRTAHGLTRSVRHSANWLLLRVARRSPASSRSHHPSSPADCSPWWRRRSPGAAAKDHVLSPEPGMLTGVRREPGRATADCCRPPLAEIMALDPLRPWRAAVCGGRSRPHGRPVRWVHVIELADGRALLARGELVAVHRHSRCPMNPAGLV